MAEAVGLGASVIGIAGLAGKTISTIIKLKAFWDDVQDAPSDLRYVMRELGIIESILAAIQKNSVDNRLPIHILNSSKIRGGLDLCQEATDQLWELLHPLELKMRSSYLTERKVATLKMLLKKGTIKKISSKLHRSLKCLSLLQTTWIE